MDALTKLPNVGPVLAGNLHAIGVETPDQLRELGALEAFSRIRQTVDPGACIHQLQALEGAVEGIRKTQLSNEKKKELTEYFRSLKR